jgi:hypothetical protein
VPCVSIAAGCAINSYDYRIVDVAGGRGPLQQVPNSAIQALRCEIGGY